MKVKTFQISYNVNIDKTINDWIESLSNDIHITSISTMDGKLTGQYFICLSYDEYQIPQFKK